MRSSRDEFTLAVLYGEVRSKYIGVTRDREATESRESLTPTFLVTGPHAFDALHFLSRSVAVHALLGAQTGCQTSACDVQNAPCGVDVSNLRKISTQHSNVYMRNAPRL